MKMADAKKRADKKTKPKRRIFLLFGFLRFGYNGWAE